MDSIRVSAKTVQDALTEASIQLGTSSDNIEYTVIDEGSKGFFGIGGRKAVIEAKRKKTDEDIMKEIFEDQPKKERQPKKEWKDSKKELKKETKQEEKDSKKDGKKESKKEEKKEEPKKEESKKDELKKDASRKDNKKDFKKDLKKEEKPERKEAKAEKKPAEKKQEGKKDIRKPVQKAESQEKAPETAAAAVMETEEEKIVKLPADPEEVKKRAVDFVSEVLKTMGMTVTVSADFEDGTLCVNIEGDDMGIMIGKRGQTLDSLQYLTSLVVNKGKASYVRVKLDTEDYRNRRKATLENLAKNIAFKVKKSRRPVFLEPMNPYERRIIHSALQNDPYVTTHSEGEEPFRKVVVTLRKDRDRSRGYSRYNDRRRHYRREDREELEVSNIPVGEPEVVEAAASVALEEE